MNKRFLVIILLAIASPLVAQEILTLQQAIEIARTNSTASRRAETRLENKYWQYRVFKSDYVPQLSLTGTLPDFNKRVVPVTQPDGSTAFRDVRNANSNVALSLSQRISATGGEIFLSSSVNRFDDLENDFTSYGGDPAIIGFRQPLFAFNPLKWDKKIEPLRYEESKREFVQEFEEISTETTQRYFQLLLAQISLEIASQNVSNNDTIYKIAQGRYDLGKIPENDLLQLELNLMNSRQAVAQAKLDFELAQLLLRSYLSITTESDLTLALPGELAVFEINEQLALDQALMNRQEAVAFSRQILEADKEVARAIGDTGLNADLFGSFGLTNSANEIPDIYQNPQDQQQVFIGFAIPILDWGRQKSRVKTAQANQQLVQYTIQQDEIDFTQEVLTQVKRFKVLRDQVAITQKADEISQRRYYVAKNRYMIGKISITDLSLALTEKDQAKRDFINSLSNLWQAYYNIRRLTLYDFEAQKPLYNPELDKFKR